MARKYQTLAEFYVFYLSEHQHPVSRGLHLFGTALVILLLPLAALTGRWGLLGLMPLVGYGFAWVGHAFFEKNKPATFTYPLFSLASDFLMLGDFLAGRLGRKLEQARRQYS